MFTIAETDPALTKDQAKPIEARLRTALLKAQYKRLQQNGRALLVVIAGMDGCGKGAAVSLLNEWMDARHIRTLAFGEPSAEERAQPFFWRYWRRLPPRGRTGIVFGSWYKPLLAEAARKSPNLRKLSALAQEIRRFEETLNDNGVQIVKLWFHLSREAQARRTDQLLADPDTAWQVMPEDIKVRKKFDRLRKAGELAIRLSNDPSRPWQIVPAADPLMRAACTGKAVLAALRTAPARPPALPAAPGGAPVPTVLQDLDYSLSLPQSVDYDRELARLQARLAQLTRHDKFRKLPLVLVFEGQDAAGKGGAIRRITHALDARQFHALPIGAPNQYEQAFPYLWRFWQNLPLPGAIAIFDRSWYGRVLVERVEKLCTPAEWRRAYGEINEFESLLRDNGALVLKFWLAVSKEKQLERFHEREQSPFKSFKITPEDWRNREKWDDYLDAANEMFEHTSTDACLWHIFPADDKRYARIKVLQTIVDALEHAMKLRTAP